MDTIVIYPVTFDPITHGHSDIITRAAKLFDRVIVAVADSADKKTLLSLEKRIELTQIVFQDDSLVTVKGFNGLLIDFVKQYANAAILRGLRAVSDFEYEFQLASMNRRLAPDIETLFLTPSERNAYISSSLVKEIAKMGGDVSQFVHPKVVDTLKQVYR